MARVHRAWLPANASTPNRAGLSTRPFSLLTTALEELLHLLPTKTAAKHPSPALSVLLLALPESPATYPLMHIASLPRRLLNQISEVTQLQRHKGERGPPVEAESPFREMSM